MPLYGGSRAAHYTTPSRNMSLASGDRAMALVDRVKNILLTPREEWQVIDAEPTTPAELYKEYIIPLAAIGPVAPGDRGPRCSGTTRSA